MKSSKEWISISDMMTGLMMVFLFISILYINESLKKVQDIEDVSKVYIENKNEIYKELHEEFYPDLKKWNAELIKKSLTIRFLSPQIMFDAGKSVVKKEFRVIMSNFCPRYFNLLYKLNDLIAEIRIEGHTSNEWKGLPPEQAYFKNMELSQDRTRAVLEYCVNIQNIHEGMKDWTKKYLTANGLSFSKPLCNQDTIRCRNLNRRVDFRVQVDTKEIIEAIKKMTK